MSVYLLTYDLNQPGQNYQSLYNALKSYGNNSISIMDSVWFVCDSRSATDVYNDFVKHIDQTDRIFVVEVTHNSQGWLAPCHSEWLRAKMGL